MGPHENNADHNIYNKISHHASRHGNPLFISYPLAQLSSPQGLEEGPYHGAAGGSSPIG